MFTHSQTYQVHSNSPYDFEADHRIYVKGKLHAQNITVGDRDLQRYTVKANSAYVLDNDVDESHTDRASVELLSTVSWDILHKENHDIFTLATHYVPL